MALSAKEQFRYWGIGAVVFLLFVWMMGDVLLPFITGMAIAYFLDPVADRLEAVGLSRSLATAVITLVAMVTIFIILFILIPVLLRETAELISVLPKHIEQFRMLISGRFPEALQEGSAAWQGLTFVIEFLRSKGGNLANALLMSALTILDVMIFLVVAPVVAFV